MITLNISQDSLTLLIEAVCHYMPKDEQKLAPLASLAFCLVEAKANSLGKAGNV